MPYTSFNALAETTVFNPEQTVTNKPGIGDRYNRIDLPPPTPSEPTSDRQPQPDAWGWAQQHQWNADITRKLANTATKDDIKEIGTRLDRIEQAVTKR